MQEQMIQQQDEHAVQQRENGVAQSTDKAEQATVALTEEVREATRTGSDEVESAIICENGRCYAQVRVSLLRCIPFMSCLSRLLGSVPLSALQNELTGNGQGNVIVCDVNSCDARSWFVCFSVADYHSQRAFASLVSIGLLPVHVSPTVTRRRSPPV